MLEQEGMNIILTFASINKDRHSVVIPQKFPGVLIDSGGFQLQTGVKTSRSISVSSYASWLEYAVKKYPEIDGYMNLDIKNDTDASLDNLHYLESRGLHPIPVWHPGEADWVLEYYCGAYDWVAVGGLFGKGKMTSKSIQRMFERIIVKYPSTKFHLLGVGITASTAFKTFRPFSIDFSTWVNVYKFGHGLQWDKNGLLREYELPKDIRDRIRVDKDFKKEMVKDVIGKIKEFGKRIEVLSEPYQKQMDFTLG